MADVTVKRVEELETVGPGKDGKIEVLTDSKYGFRRARDDLGVTSFGINVLDLPPGYENYPDHDHSESGQEEVYMVLEGDATLRTGDEEQHIEPGTLVRVGPDQKRKWIPGDSGVRLLALGGKPGAAYEGS